MGNFLGEYGLKLLFGIVLGIFRKDKVRDYGRKKSVFSTFV